MSHKSIEAYLNLPANLWQGREQSVTAAGKTQPLDVWGPSFDEAGTLLATGPVISRE